MAENASKVRKKKATKMKIKGNFPKFAGGPFVVHDLASDS